MKRESIAPIILSEDTVFPVNDLAVGADSGWRPTNTKMVEILKHKFLYDGEWGIGIMGKPQVWRTPSNGHKYAVDGREKLFNGKSVITCLQDVKAIWDNEEERAKHLSLIHI